MRKRLIGILVMMIIPCFLCGQEVGDTEVLTDDFMVRLAKVPDLLYIEGERCLMSNSPLADFMGYKKIFKGITDYEVVNNNFVFGVDIPPIGINYRPVWLIHDGKLYLSDIIFYSHSVMLYFSDKSEPYRVMEDFTDCKFENAVDSFYSSVPIGPCGIMPAKWFSGTIYVKPSLAKTSDEHYLEHLREWEQKPYMMLTFKNGCVISKESIDNKTSWKRER